MYGLVVQEHFNDLVVGTYWRGFWIMDDITPLQQVIGMGAGKVIADGGPVRHHRRCRGRSLCDDSEGTASGSAQGA